MSNIWIYTDFQDEQFVTLKQPDIMYFKTYMYIIYLDVPLNKKHIPNC